MNIEKGMENDKCWGVITHKLALAEATRGQGSAQWLEEEDGVFV
jgi:hypothetical protein